MPPNVRSLRYTQRQLEFLGGLNTQSPPTEISDNELTVCDNFYFDKSGNLIKRPGLHKYLDIGAVADKHRILGVDLAHGRFLVANSNLPTPILYSVFDGGPTATPVTGYGNERAFWTKYINGTQYIGFSSSTRAMTATLTVGGAIANAPGSTCAAFHKDRLFLASNTVANRLHFSDAVAPGTFQVSSTIDIGVDDVQSITGLVSLGDLLIVFKTNSVWVLYVQGDSAANWTKRKINSSLGTLSNGSTFNPNGCYSYITHDNEIYFISTRGLFKTNGQSFINLSEKIWPFNSRDYDNPYAGFWRLTRWNNTLIMVLGGQFLPRICYTYDLGTGAWSTWSFLSSAFYDVVYFPAEETPTIAYGNMLATTLTPANDHALYNFREVDIDEAGYTTSIAAGWNSYTDGGDILVNNGAAYTASFQTKDFTSFTDWLWRSKWIGLEYISRTPGPTIGVKADGLSVASSVPGFNTLAKTYKSPGAGRCRAFSFACTHSATSPFQFNRANLHYVMKRSIIASGAP